FVKYDIDVSLDEVENNDSGIKLKYRFVLLSNPTNTKISVEGIASILGNESEVSKSLEPDQRNIPLVVNTVYQEIFPLLYVISKSMHIPCPSYKLSQLSAAQKPEIKQEEPVSQELEVPPSNLTDIAPEIKTESADPPSEPQNQEVIQEASVSSI
ncbi:MAG: hypothetical protein ACREAN_05345, partial [Nitrosopumilaceae archaeon]